MNKILGSLFSLGIVGGFAYLAVKHSSGGLKFVREPKVGDVVSIKIGDIIIDGIRITHIHNNDIQGVSKDGIQTFDRRDILQNSLSVI